MHSIQEALSLILTCSKSFGTEEVSIDDALNRVLAENIYADRDYPPFNRSTMDGYAVISADFEDGKIGELKLIETLHAGNVATQKVIPGTCIKIMTGAPLPPGGDAVIKVEECEENGDQIVFKTGEVTYFKNVAPQGEDAKKNDIIIKENTLLDATEIAVLAVVGKAMVKVYKLPEVTVFSTGNEIVAVHDPILPHQIRDSNSYSLKSFFKKYNIAVTALKVADDQQKLKDAIQEYLSKDILILSGGVSKGDADYVPEVLNDLGVKELFHRVKIKPGNPLWFGSLPNGGVVFGLPGNPVSVQVAFKIFIEPYLRKCFNLKPLQPLFFPLAAEKIKKSKFDEYFPCKIKSVNKTIALLPMKMNGSGDISATMGSDGIALHPEVQDVMEENAVVEFYMW